MLECLHTRLAITGYVGGQGNDTTAHLTASIGGISYAYA